MAQLTDRERAEALYAEGRLGYKRIAGLLGLDRDQVRRWVAPGTRCRCGGRKSYVSPRCRSCTAAERRAKTSARLAVIARRYAEGDLAEAIAADLGVSTGAVHNRLHRARQLGLSTGPPRKRGPIARAGAGR